MKTIWQGSEKKKDFQVMDVKVANRKPYYQELEKGKTYWWCSCGRSQKQPYCDGSHKGTGFEPVKYVAQQDEEVLFCGCKHTKSGPFCDGSHNNLPGGYAEDDPLSPANRTVPLSSAKAGARTFLNGRCYVFAIDQAQFEEKEGFRFCPVISEALGARYQSQFYGELAARHSPIMTLGERHVILFIAGGAGTVTISGRAFAVKEGDGVYIAPGEGFALTRNADDPLKVFISASPAASGLQWLSHMPGNFQKGLPQRIVSIDDQQRQAMAARYFQMLVDKSIGSTVVTQFIGHIPRSKAEPHRHLYEEALIILTGHGMMWTEDRKTPVKAGDVIFLPSKQIHSLEATDESGLLVVGVIYPGDNPSVNY